MRACIGHDTAARSSRDARCMECGAAPMTRALGRLGSAPLLLSPPAPPGAARVVVDVGRIEVSGAFHPRRAVRTRLWRARVASRSAAALHLTPARAAAHALRDPAPPPPNRRRRRHGSHPGNATSRPAGARNLFRSPHITPSASLQMPLRRSTPASRPPPPIRLDPVADRRVWCCVATPTERRAPPLELSHFHRPTSPASSLAADLRQ
jgi:hypothetical protein